MVFGPKRGVAARLCTPRPEQQPTIICLSTYICFQALQVEVADLGDEPKVGKATAPTKRKLANGKSIPADWAMCAKAARQPSGGSKAGSTRAALARRPYSNHNVAWRDCDVSGVEGVGLAGH